MPIIRKIKEQISSTTQRALGIDELRYTLGVALQTLERLSQFEGKLLAQLESTSAQTEALSAGAEAFNVRLETLGSQVEALTGWTKMIIFQLDQLQNTVLDAALRRLQGHPIEIASLIDIGASNGSWSRAFARYFPDRHHLLVDANQAHVPELTKACQESPNWHFALTAVGGIEGELYFDDSDPLVGVLAATPWTDKYRPCPVTTIDHLLEKYPLPGPFMIKLDTHGVEIPILTGAAETLKQTSAIVIEAYNFTFGEPAVPFWDLCRYMLQLGFRPLDAFDILYREVDNAFWQFDLLFVRSDLPLFQDPRYFIAGRH